MYMRIMHAHHRIPLNMKVFTCVLSNMGTYGNVENAKLYFNWLFPHHIKRCKYRNLDINKQIYSIVSMITGSIMSNYLSPLNNMECVPFFRDLSVCIRPGILDSLTSYKKSNILVKVRY